MRSVDFKLKKETYLTDDEHINKLLALLSLATVWAFILEWLHQ